MKLWWNGTIIDEDEAVIPLNDHGFLYGMGLFETFRTYGGKPFLLDRHIDRLRAGCRDLRIHYKPDKSEIIEAIASLMKCNGLDDAYIRWSVSAGPAAHGLPAPSGYAKPNVLLMAKPLPARSGAGANAKQLHLLQLPRSTPEGYQRTKSFHYMNNILAKWELAERTASPDAEGLFTDGAGNVVEGIVSNVFWVRRGELRTPSAETGCLPGVTRGVVLELARDLGIPVGEGRFPWEELLEAEEAFVTNSIQELVPAVCLFNKEGRLCKSWNGEGGRTFAALQHAYYAMVWGNDG